jgi:hypothetical protein
MIIVKLCEFFFLISDAPEDGRLRLKHVGLSNYLLIRNWIDLIIFMYLF